MDERALPALTGSPKQVAWADDLRGKFVEQLGRIQRVINERQDGLDPSGECEKLIMRTLGAILESQTSARFWIDRRDVSWQRLVKGQMLTEQGLGPFALPEHPAHLDAVQIIIQHKIF